MLHKPSRASVNTTRPYKRLEHMDSVTTAQKDSSNPSSTSIETSDVLVSANVPANPDVFEDESLMTWSGEEDVMLNLQDVIPEELSLETGVSIYHYQQQIASENTNFGSMDAYAPTSWVHPSFASAVSYGDTTFPDRPHFPVSTIDAQTLNLMMDYDRSGSNHTSPCSEGDPSGINLPSSAMQASLFSATASSRWASWDQLGQVLDSNEIANSDLLRNRRRRNRVSMQRCRQRKKHELQQMKTTIAHLEKQYDALCVQVDSEKTVNEEIKASKEAQYPARKILTQTKQLQAENALLQATIPEYAQWKARLRKLLKSMPYSINSSSDRGTNFTVLESHEAELIYQFHPLSEEDVGKRMMDNMYVVYQVHSQLVNGNQDTFVDCVQFLGWDVRRRVNGCETEYLFSKRLKSDLSAYEILDKTWRYSSRLEQIKKIETDMLRLDLLQEINSNVLVFGRDVRSNDDQSVFRTVYLQYKMESNIEWTDPENLCDPKLSADGYVLGVQSMNPDRPSSIVSFGVSDDKNLQWADMMFAIHFTNVIDPETLEPAVEVRWMGKSNYKTEQLANRNNTDTVMTVLRWEMMVLAPALNLVSLSSPSSDNELLKQVTERS